MRPWIEYLITNASAGADFIEWTHDIDADTEYFAGLGYEAANSANAGAIRFAYYDTRPLLGCMLEVVEKKPAVEATFGRIAEVCADWDGKDPIRSSADLFK